MHVCMYVCMYILLWYLREKKYVLQWIGICQFIVLTFNAPRISESWIKIKINLNFYFHIPLRPS